MKSFQSHYQGGIFRFPIHFDDKTDREIICTNTRFDYASIYRNTREVSANFLETKWLSSGTVVFAIGDSARVPDPLPVACVRHYLRRKISLDTSSPSIAAARMNEMIYDCCGAPSCLSCFYARYIPCTQMLRYVNAGHDAPILVRRHPDDILRLQENGPVLGLQEAPVFAEHAIKLRRGDRLVAFTHGVIAALAARNACGADSVLIDLTRRYTNLSPIQLANRIIDECEGTPAETSLDKGVFVASLDDGADITSRELRRQASATVSPRQTVSVCSAGLGCSD